MKYISFLLANSFITLILTFLTALLIATPVWSFSFSPIMAEFTPSGDAATRTFTAENGFDEKIAVQITCFARHIDADGLEKLDPSDDFKIFPDQFTLAPNSSRAVRVTYHGAKDIKIEQAYRFIAEQLPVNIKDEAKKQADNSGQMKFLVRYATAIYVAPNGLKSNIQIQARQIQQQKEKKLELQFDNAGGVHQILFPATVTIANKGEVGTVLSKDLLKPLDKQNLLPGGKRVFVLPWPAKLKDGTLEASVRFN